MNNPLARSGAAIISKARLVKQWARDLLHLCAEDIVSVSELSCALPDCPPRETVIVVLFACGETRQISIHKALLEVDHDDIVCAIAANSA
ncbi:hypothetical protein EN41_24525 [Agrobacterium tumefaciens]|uniref:Uncharacterized protein n=1 Tax=Agrobacterium fabrum (strain C58 / ATCC 33970) TaxID=176299 RepID=A9CET9_AGRFC|nr:hypothetical protein [Agrobacterium fabrum]KEY53777.1 hypothetical protein EN41_24525 [Agrobacterium tumefaciens]AAK90203.1 hypothetical protein Atu3183 [Agrobacterium fabrum str. C58]AYM59006.1 hypothetical protein At1D132_29940 [Agrobacterium fabrum]KJX87053.1 hypothetical protein SY94_3179 [Agrobacterium tumefaciens]MCX2875807.1 hypothetical protein [Agrobacterium fabrum]